MGKRLVVVSGLPGSGKTTLARLLARALNLPLIDKDDILESLFREKGIGDAAWRRALSRESDLTLQAAAAAASDAVLVSHWRLAGMAPDSGTPTEWLREASLRVVNIHCCCEPELAARRFLQRKRHAGHLDQVRSYAEVLAALKSIAAFGGLEIGHRIDIDTNGACPLDALLARIDAAIRSDWE